MSTRARLLVLIGLVTGLAAYTVLRVSWARDACRAGGGTYDLVRVSCTEKPRPIYLDRGISRG